MTGDTTILRADIYKSCNSKEFIHYTKGSNKAQIYYMSL